MQANVFVITVVDDKREQYRTQASDSLIEIKDHDGGDAYGREESMGAAVITHGDSAPVLESAEHVLYLVALLVSL